jgi:hypothetical protein
MQRSRDGRPFRMPIIMEVFWAGNVGSIEPKIDRNDQVVIIASKVQMVSFNPNETLLSKLTFPASTTEHDA